MEESKVIPRPVPPCKECEDRTEKCHTTCERYREYQRERQAYNKAVRKERTKYWGDAFDGRTGEGKA